MLNRRANGPMVYKPAYLNIAPGDTVRFLPTQPGHNAAAIEGVIPEGTAPFKSKINARFEVTLTEIGAYGIKCSPYYAMGMVMLIEVGEKADVSLPEVLPKRATERFEQILTGRDQPKE
ncbi:pseudoazurin [Paracoccus litorisediminis]|jgi:pseudoazurin